MRRWATIPIFILTILVLGPLAAYGQGETTASIRGQVLDVEGGETLPGANVVAVHVPSGTRYGTSTNTQGRYTLSNLRVGGPYRVTVSFVGYQSKREEGITLELGETQRIDFQLREQTEELQEIQVVARTGGLLSSDRQGVVTNISTQDIEEQPTMSRSIADVARLTPQAYVVNSNDDGPAISIAGQWNRFNSIYIDGAVTNDVFGLSAQGTPGGQTGASPISLSAVEAMSVDVSPFEVTKSGFVGGAINFTTKSGTNDFEGSAEFYRRSAALTQQEFVVDGDTLVNGLPSASDNRFVFSLGGPIIEDKLFFFVNADIRRQEDAQPLQQGFRGSEALSLNKDAPVDDASLTSVFELREFMQRNTGYDPGTPGDKSTILDANKFLGRLDYNVNEDHRLTARYFFNDNYNVDAFQSTQGEINFANDSEVFPSVQHNAMLQWNGNFGEQVATKTTATLQNVEDDRGVRGEPFPHITIETPGDATVELGSEPFSHPNFLEQTVGTFTNETDIFLGDHTLTVGTHNEFYSIDNRFAIFGPGLYTFFSVDDFAETVCHYAEQNQGNYGIDGPGPVCSAEYPNPEPQTGEYLNQYSLLDNDPDKPGFQAPGTDDTNLRSDFNSTKLGFFVQDKWQALDRLSLTFGLRADLPKILTQPGAHPSANNEALPAIRDAGYDLHGATAGDMPGWRVFWSPRAGFDYTLGEERNTKIRGGAGVFTSRLPYVWPGAAYLNNGKSADFLFASDVFGVGTAPLRRPENRITRPEIFGTNPNQIPPTGDLIIFRDDFSYPRVLRTSLALDQSLPFGLTGTLEGQYSSKLKDVVVKNVNLKQPDRTLEGPDNRPIYRAAQVLNGNDENPLYPDANPTIDPSFGDILLLDNTDKGYSYTVTAKLQKAPTAVWDGATVRGNVSYTYGDSRGLNQFGDTVGSNWDENPHSSTTNDLTLGRSPYSLGHKVQLSLGLRQEITQNVSANLSAYYTGQSGRPFSYTIGGTANERMIGDGGGPPLFYIPKDASNLQFAPITDGEGNVVRSPQQQADDLDAFINSIDYLSENRGDYAIRNADRTPFEGVVDLRFALNFSGDLLGRNQRLSLTADVFNFSSLLGDLFGTDWGYRYQQEGTVSPVELAYLTDEDGNGNPTPVYQSNVSGALGEGGDPLTGKDELFDLESGTQTYSSLYQVKFGVKYSF